MNRQRMIWCIAAAIMVGCSPSSNEGGPPPTIRRLGDDLLGSGGEVRVADSVAGDVLLSGGDLEFSGVANGAYLGAGGDQAIGGRIVGSVRAAGGNVVLSADVGRNVTIAAGNVVVDSGAAITHNAYLAAGAVRVRGEIGRSLVAIGSEVTLDGTVGGDVEVSGGRLRVGPGARITGGLRHRVPARNVSIDPAARIAGGVTALPAAEWTGFGRMLRAIWLIGFLIAGAVIVALLPRLATAAADSTAERTGASAAFGVVWVVGVPILIIVAAITVVGLPLAAIATAAWLILLYLGRAAVAVWLGELLVQRVSSGKRLAPVASFLIGALVLLLIGLIPVIGPFIGFVVTVLGAGAVLVTLWPRRQQPDSTAAAGYGQVRYD